MGKNAPAITIRVSHKMKNYVMKLSTLEDIPQHEMLNRILMDYISLIDQDPTTAAKKTTRQKRSETYRVEDRVNEELNKILPTYNSRMDKSNEIIKAYKGVLTRKEYKQIVSVLHPDRHPDADAKTVTKLNGAFDILQQNKDLLCGEVKEDSSAISLPTTVEGLLKMRKSH